VPLEPTEGETRGRGRAPWIIAAAVIVVGIIVAVVVVRSGKSGTNAESGGGGSNTAHVDVSGSITGNFVLPTKSVSIAGLGTVVPLADVTWQDAQGQALSQIDAQLADLQSKLNAAQQRVEAKQSALRQ